ncbi:MAG: efflux RND transporter periplasmic adaptor subunit [Gemmatimonadales bacterium]
MTSVHRSSGALLLLLVLGAGACGSDAGGEKSGSAAPAGGSAAKARTQPSITLAATDVATVGATTIEDGVALTGDLNPIETVDVHARIEGDLVGVYVREGQEVSAGQLLARFEASEQESAHQSAEADRVAAQSDLSNAQWTLEQNAELYKAGAIAQQAYKSSEQAVVSARARLAAADAKLRAMGNEERDTRVVAPTTGIVSKRVVEGGEHVAKGAPLFTIVRNNVLELAAAVPARLSMALRVGQVVHFVADGRRFDGQVARLSPTIDPATRALTVYVQIPNPGGLLRGGTFATGRVVSRTLTNVIAVPTNALRQSAEDGKPYVYRIDGRTINVAPVQLGAVDDKRGLAQVTDGLQSGDRVVVGNVGALGRGMQVTIAGQEAATRPVPAR